MRRLMIGFLFLGLFVVVCAMLTPHEGNAFQSLWDRVCHLTAKLAPQGDAAKVWPAASIGNATPETTGPLGMGAGVELAPVVPIEQALNFAVSIPQILGSWPQVSTGIVHNNNLFGYRVPLVTGMAEHDITGSLTYFFGPGKILRRIQFEGDTGDARRLIAWLTNEFRLAPDLTESRGTFLYRTTSESPVMGELRVYPRTIIQASLPHRRFEISLMLNRPQATSAAL